MKLRQRVWIKLSQLNDNISIPTEKASLNKQIPPPPTFQASSVYPIRSGFNAATIAIIDQFSNILNIAMHYITSGKINFQVFRNNSFNFDASSAPSVDQKNLMNFSKKVFNIIYNSGNAYDQQLSGKEIASKMDSLINCQELQNLSSLNPTGIVAQKIQGNLKTILINYLNYIKLSNQIK